MKRYDTKIKIYLSVGTDTNEDTFDTMKTYQNVYYNINS